MPWLSRFFLTAPLPQTKASVLTLTALSHKGDPQPIKETPMQRAILALAAGLLMTVGTTVSNAGECTQCRAESKCGKGCSNSKYGNGHFGIGSGCHACGRNLLQHAGCHHCRLGHPGGCGHGYHGLARCGCGGHWFHPHARLLPPHMCQPIGPGGPYTGPSGPPVATYGYPYYTIRGPRDFLMDNPPTIGR